MIMRFRSDGNTYEFHVSRKGMKWTSVSAPDDRAKVLNEATDAVVEIYRGPSDGNLFFQIWNVAQQLAESWDAKFTAIQEPPRGPTRREIIEQDIVF